MDLDDFAGDDEIAAAMREVYRLRRENGQLRAALEPLIGLAVRGHEFSAVLNGHCATCTLISQARAALSARPPGQ